MTCTTPTGMPTPARPGRSCSYWFASFLNTLPQNKTNFWVWIFPKAHLNALTNFFLLFPHQIQLPTVVQLFIHHLLLSHHRGGVKIKARGQTPQIIILALADALIVFYPWIFINFNFHLVKYTSQIFGFSKFRYQSLFNFLFCYHFSILLGDLLGHVQDLLS